MRNTKRALASLSESRLPHCDSLSKLESLLRMRVEEVSLIAARRRLMYIRVLLLSAPVWVALLGALVTLATFSGLKTAGENAALLAAIGFIGPVTWVLMLVDHDYLSDLLKRTTRTADKLDGHDLLSPFGGVEALTIRMLHDVPSVGLARTCTIGSEVAWWWSQLEEPQRQVLRQQGSVDLTIAEVLAAFAQCQPHIAVREDRG
jgi:hypothetical protein